MAAKSTAKISPTVRVHPRTREQLRRLSTATGRSTPDLLAEAVDRVEQDGLLASANEAFAALREDPEAWSEELEERRAWDGAETPPDRGR